MFHRSADIPMMRSHQRPTVVPNSGHANVFHANNENLMPGHGNGNAAKSSLKLLNTARGGSGKSVSISIQKPGTQSDANSTKTPGKSGRNSRRRALGDISNKKGDRQQPSSTSSSSSSSAAKGTSQLTKVAPFSAKNIKPVQLIWSDENSGTATKKKAALKSKQLKSSASSLRSTSSKPSISNKAKLVPSSTVAGVESRTSSSSFARKQPLRNTTTTIMKPRSKSSATVVASQPRQRAVDFNIPSKNKGSYRKATTVRFPDQLSASITTNDRSSRKNIDFLADIEFSAGRTWEQQMSNGDFDDGDADVDRMASPSTWFDDDDDDSEGGNAKHDEVLIKMKERAKQQREKQRLESQALEAQLEASIHDSLKKQDEQALHELLHLVDDIKIFGDDMASHDGLHDDDDDNMSLDIGMDLAFPEDSDDDASVGI